MYFAYTSLLTIGYGDYTPLSNSGKAFFVFWSLLAVPTLTILISNMGDTVIKAFRDLTIWVGSLTVLPGENGPKSTMSAAVRRIGHGKLKPEIGEDDDSPEGASEQKMLDRLAGHVEEKELERAEEAGEHGDYLERDIRFYHFVLAKEIRKLMKDVNVSPPRQYTYDEWNYYLRLIGQDEDDASKHRKPRVHHDRNKDSSPDLGTADEGDNSSWSWLGVRSPLMGSKTEAEWLLQRLTAMLENEMGKMRSPDAKKEPPPISMADLKDRKGSSGSENEIKKGLQNDVGHAEIRRRGKNSV
jgi:potassium channel subfamily K